MSGRRLLSRVALIMLPVATAFAQDATNSPPGLYRERYRPQFHYTVKKGWINDPCGLVFYEGEYHLFNDHNPFGNKIPGELGAKDRPPSRWSHAVSRDLVHWQELPIAILPDKLGAIYSGSGVVDAANTAGFARGDDRAIVLAYTSAGRPFSQSISYSTDRGRTWTPYKNNPVVPNQGLSIGERDPRVFWHDPTKKWIMVLFVKRGVARFFTSDDLKTWTHASDFKGKGFYECPDMFEIALESHSSDSPVTENDNRAKTKWILYDASFKYYVGSFDGKTFTPEVGPIRGDYGKNFYAAQTWTNTAQRRVQIAWMWLGKYPDMPFTQQMSFPCELKLISGPSGPRLYRYPIVEIAALRQESFVIEDRRLKVGENALAGVSGDLFDIELSVRPGKAGQFTLRMHGQTVMFADNELSAVGQSVPLVPIKGVVTLRILLDRTSLEVFANNGEVSMTSCIVPPHQESPLALHAHGTDVHIESLTVHKLRSAWEGHLERGGNK